MPSKRPIPIAWKTCPHCDERFDEGNALAAFYHRNRDCRPRATTPDTGGSHED